MKKYFPLLLFFISCGLAFAQNYTLRTSPVKIDWSAGETGSSRYWYTKVLGQSDEGTFLLRSNLSLESNDEPSGFRTRKFALGFYDNLFSFKWEKQILPAVKEGTIEKIFFASDKVVILYSVYAKNNESIQLWSQTMDGRGTGQTTPVQILEMQDVRKQSEINFEYSFSSDHSVLGISARFSKKINDSIPKNASYISAVLLNEHFTSFFKKEIMLPLNENEFAPDNFFVSADSCFYLADKVQDIKGAGFLMYSFDAKTEKSEFTRVDAPKKNISEYMISFDEKNKKIIAGGFYSEQNISSAGGYFFISVNTGNLSVSASSSHKFDEAFLSNFVGEPKTADKTELLNYKLNHLVLKNDGGVVMLAESRYTTEYTYFDFFTKSYITRTVFHFDNIIAISVKADGSADWQKSIAKKQESQEDGGYYSSYCHIVYGDNVYLLFDSFEGKLTSILLQSLSGSGEEKRFVLTDTSEDAASVPRAGKQVDSNVAVIPSFRKNKFTLAKILF